MQRKGQVVQDDERVDTTCLVQAIRQGDVEAAGRIFIAYSKMVERTIYLVIGNDPEISDLTHDTFLTAFTGIGQLRDAQAFGSWLRGIATWTAQSYKRRNTRRRILGNRHWSVFLQEASAPSRTGLGEVADSLREVLSGMSHVDRSLLLMREIERRSLAEIARCLATSIRTASRMLSKAHARFVAAASNHPELLRRLPDNRRLNRARIKLQTVQT